MYVFANDKTSASTCTGACAANWPFVPAPATLPASLPGVTGKLGTTTRSGGARQLTIAGHPVYTFAGDSAAGQTNGQGSRPRRRPLDRRVPGRRARPEPGRRNIQATTGPSY